MRTLKFRAWDSVKKTFPFVGFHIIGECTVFDLVQQYSIENFVDLEVEQFTGLKDKYGKEIYEGDILKIPEDEMNGSVRSPYCHVWYTSHSAEWFVSYNHLHSEVGEPLWKRNDDSEIIGNIHENPELLEE